MKQSAQSILVVDDNQDIRELVVHFLHAADFEVLTASDGASALAILAQRRVDLLLLDVMMPGISGLETLRQLRSSTDGENSDIPVIMITARTSSDDIDAALALGAHSYIIKPFRGPELRAEVQRAFLQQITDTSGGK